MKTMKYAPIDKIGTSAFVSLSFGSPGAVIFSPAISELGTCAAKFVSME